MSSLAAARADNFYYPPNWDPSKGGLNHFYGKHALGSRAKKIDQGILVVRFEMPYDCWCKNCKEPIAKGVRFNAEKKKIGMYFTTPLYEFSMKCRFCEQQFVIKIDPKTRDYVFVSGIEKKAINPDDLKLEPFHKLKEQEYELEHNSIMKLEHSKEDKRIANKMKPFLEQIHDESEYLVEYDHELNRKARDIIRKQKKEEKKNSLLADKLGVKTTILPLSQGDVIKAKHMKYRKSNDAIVKEKIKRSQIVNSSVFSSKCSQEKKKEINAIVKNGFNYKAFKPIQHKQNTSTIKFEIIGKKKT